MKHGSGPSFHKHRPTRPKPGEGHGERSSKPDHPHPAPCSESTRAAAAAADTAPPASAGLDTYPAGTVLCGGFWLENPFLKLNC